MASSPEEVGNLPPLSNALILHEGDTIVLSAKHDLTAEGVAYIRDSFLKQAGVRAIVLGPGLEVVREPDAEDAEPWTDPKPWRYSNGERAAHSVIAEWSPRTREQYDAEESDRG